MTALQDAERLGSPLPEDVLGEEPATVPEEDIKQLLTR